MRKIGIALGGGGARAAAHIGVLDAFDKAGIPISFISGSSSGSIVAAAYAVRNLEFLKNNAAKIRKRQLIEAADFVISQQGLLRGARVKKVIDLITLDKDFEDTKIPLALIATNVETMQEVVIREGSLTKAVLASSCIPGLFTPVEYQGKSLIDGGLLNHLPTKVLYEMGAEYVIAVETRTQKPHLLVKVGRLRKGRINQRIVTRRLAKSKSLNILDIILSSYGAVVDGVAVDKLKETRYDLLIKPDIEHIGRSEFHRADELIAIGRKVGEELAERIRREAGLTSDN